MRALIIETLRNTLAQGNRSRYERLLQAMAFQEYKGVLPSKKILSQYTPKNFNYEVLSDSELFSLYEIFTYLRAAQR